MGAYWAPGPGVSAHPALSPAPRPSLVARGLSSYVKRTFHAALASLVWQHNPAHSCAISPRGARAACSGVPPG